ncbi:hypothetical protein SALBM311S_03952 [Streptomyces alboniger]
MPNGCAPDRGSEAFAGVEGERIAGQTERDDGDEEPALDVRQDPAGRWCGPVERGQRAVAQRGAGEEPGGEGDEPCSQRRQQDHDQRAGLEDGQVLGEGGLEGGAAEAGDVEDLLHRDRPAGQAHYEQAQVRQQSRQAAAYRLAGDTPPGQSACGGGQRPGFGEGAGQQVVEEPSDDGAGGQAEREGRQHRPLGAVPAEGGQPAQLDADDGGEDGRGEELGQRGEDRRAAASRTPPVEAPVGAEPQGAGADQRGGDGGDREGHRHQQQGHPEGLENGGRDLVAGQPRPAGVPVPQSAEPLSEQGERASIQVELGADVGQDLGGGVAVGRACLEDGERRIGPGQPGQQADAAHQGDRERGPPHGRGQVPSHGISAAFRCRRGCARTGRGARR